MWFVEFLDNRRSPEDKRVLTMLYWHLGGSGGIGGCINLLEPNKWNYGKGDQISYTIEFETVYEIMNLRDNLNDILDKIEEENKKEVEDYNKRIKEIEERYKKAKEEYLKVEQEYKNSIKSM